uniref:Anthocyanin acyltransferase n=2 Tax=Lotus japonicus TaxID=34305 RepID=I3T627_LOTJA|nr:unknown [Lotus japonicus]
MSTFVVACSLVWVSMIKLEQRKGDYCVAKGSDELCYFLFLADCRGRPELSFPSTYFGNCLAFCTVAMKKDEVVGENGLIEVANAVEREIRNWKSDPLQNAETSISDYRELLKPGKSLLTIGGSPKLAVYETDFGWGKPKKSESVHLDTFRIVSMSDCRDKDGGMEVGLALEKVRMNDFINILEQQFSKVVCD